MLSGLKSVCSYHHAAAGAVQLQERYLLEFPITAAEVQEVKTKLETYTQRVAALMRQGQVGQLTVPRNMKIEQHVKLDNPLCTEQTCTQANC